jgi:Fe(II)/alpha-ketoglutarate-dependent arginine beta-hydroxylase
MIQINAPQYLKTDEQIRITLNLSEPEIRDIRSLAGTLANKYSAAEGAEFVNSAAVWAGDLPGRVRAFINDFKTYEPVPGYCVISGYPIDEEKIGATPTHWKFRSANTLQEEILLILLGTLLGDVFGWATQQDGHLIHDVVPIKGHENEQLGSNSEEWLWWHTEDAFHPYSGDYLVLMCLRNPDNVATIVGNISTGDLTAQQIELLSQPHFLIRPDESHLRKNKSDMPITTMPEKKSEVSYDEIERMNTRPQKKPVLLGNPAFFYACIDPYFMDYLEDNGEAQDALECLINSIDKSLHNLVLRKGDICFIDNRRVVHGRQPFKARYDGNDRWLKRINITRDLRKSSSARLNCKSRIIF